jgi:hypothetical protein
VFASIAAIGTESLQAAGAAPLEALNGGYRLAFIGGAVSAALGALLGGCFMRTRLGASSPGPVAPHG